MGGCDGSREPFYVLHALDPFLQVEFVVLAFQY